MEKKLSRRRWKIVRYAANVERELHRTIQQLVRLQKHRKEG